MSLTENFSTDYSEARRRFRQAATQRHFRVESYPIDQLGPEGEELTIDLARRGSPTPSWAVVLTCGVHGVEAPLGSAIQLAFLNSLPADWSPPADGAVVFVHAVNPYGYAWRRRFNENNVDLNRNFLLADQQYAGAPPLASKFHRVLGAKRRPSRWHLSTSRMAYLALRHGMQAYWDTLPVGQYELDDWLFYGGKELAASGQILSKHFRPFVGPAEEVVHLDFHTGLGKWANLELLLGETEPPGEVAWWKEAFDNFEVNAQQASERYAATGGYGPWCQQQIDDCRYHFATAEFGSYSPLHVMRALAEETRCTNTVANIPREHWSRRRLAEAFVPRNRQWRETTVSTGLRLVERAIAIMTRRDRS